MAGAVCPYLGLFDDPETALAYASTSNRCYRAKKPVGVSHNHQNIYCLEKNHTSCPVYLHGLDTSRSTSPQQKPAGSTPPPNQPTVSTPKEDRLNVVEKAVLTTAAAGHTQEDHQVGAEVAAPTLVALNAVNKAIPASDNKRSIPPNARILNEQNQVIDDIFTSFNEPVTQPVTNDQGASGKIGWWIWAGIVLIFLIFGGVVSVAWGMGLSRHPLFFKSVLSTPSVIPSPYKFSTSTISVMITDPALIQTINTETLAATLTKKPTKTAENTNLPTATPQVVNTSIPPTKVVNCYPPSTWVTYRVKAGDTLSSLSRTYGVSINQLQQANCMGNSTFLYVSQLIYVPYAAPSVTPKPFPSSSPKPPNPTAINTPTSIITPVVTETLVSTNTVAIPISTATP